MALKLITKICKNCGKPCKIEPYREKEFKYCSRRCHGLAVLCSKKNRKKCIENHVFGKNHPNWKGGKRKHTEGYIEIKVKDHPYANSNGYVMEHRYIMEQHIGRYLKREESIHHINGNKTDNRIENLELFSNNSEHTHKYHMRGINF